MKLIATKNQTYKTRHLVAGDPFEEASERRAHLLISIGKARPAESATPRKATAAPLEAPKDPITSYESPQIIPASGDEIARLRNTARRLGLVVDKRWGSQRLRDEIAKVRGS